MTKILSNQEIAPEIFELIVEAPSLAKKARAGHFVLAMAENNGERIPLTVADYDAQAGTVSLVVMAVGVSTRKIVKIKAGEDLFAIVGPLGHPSEIENFDKVVMVAGGVGTAPIYPIAKALKKAGNHVTTIQGARNADLLFWSDQLRDVSDELIITTDDGSAGRKALVTEPLKELLEANSADIGRVFTIGPAIMMKFCCETVRPFGNATIASLNTVMIDGTGMCGGCRVRVGKETKFTCVDGPEFDGLLVDWDLVISRQKLYCEEESCALERYVESI